MSVLADDGAAAPGVSAVDRRVAVRVGRACDQDGPCQVVQGFGFAHDLIGEADPEPLLEAEQKFDPLQAANSQVAIERIVEPHRAGGRHGPQLPDQLGRGAEYFFLDRSPGLASERDVRHWGSEQQKLGRARDQAG